jgi:putative Mg2+ transporter-C (MgtC) family protein
MLDYLLNIFNEAVFTTDITIGSTIVRLSISLILGVTIGYERQIRRRDAGLRTFSLICTGSAGAMLISIWIPQIYPDFLNGDPGRIAAQVLTGIGFLGAGAIMRGKGSVQGLTTAACIWQTAVIGLAVGAGLYSCAIVATLFTIFVLVTVEKLEQKLFLDGANRILVIKYADASPDFEQLKKTINDSGIKVNNVTYSINYTKNEAVITFKVTIKTNTPQKLLLDNLHDDSKITGINMIS